MIIVCEKCKVRLELDEELMRGVTTPALRVRCSQCKHVFAVDIASREQIPELRTVAAGPAADSAHVVAVCNQKGGVAKTSTCLNVGASLSLGGNRVLLIDFDPQANLSLVLGRKNEASVYEICRREIAIESAIRPVGQNLFLLPASGRIAVLARDALRRQDFGFVLRDALRPVMGSFDYILVDTPPSMKFFTPNALMAARFVIIPTQSEFLAMNGVMRMEGIIQALAPTRRLDYRILVTMYDGNNTAARAVYRKLQESYRGKLFEAIIPADCKMQESQIVNQNVVSYDRSAPSARQYLNLARELEALLPVSRKSHG